MAQLNKITAIVHNKLGDNGKSIGYEVTAMKERYNISTENDIGYKVKANVT